MSIEWGERQKEIEDEVRNWFEGEELASLLEKAREEFWEMMRDQGEVLDGEEDHLKEVREQFLGRQ